MQTKTIMFKSNQNNMLRSKFYAPRITFTLSQNESKYELKKKIHVTNDPNCR